MDIESASWIAELGMEDPNFIQQCEIMDCFDEELAAALGEDFQYSLLSENNSSSPTLNIPGSSSTTTISVSSSMEAPPQVCVESPTKQHRPNTYSACTVNNMSTLDQALSSPIILSFGNSNLAENSQQLPLGAMNPEDEAVSDIFMSQGAFVSNHHDETTKSGQGTKRSNTNTRPPSQTYDHIMAERKRREHLSQQFVALSAIVPGLKKMDKTSVLGEAIKYLKQLQERVKIMEEQATKQTMESVVFIKKSQLLLEDDACSSEENSNFIAAGSSEPLPEIEARVCDKNVLMRIQCEKRKGVLVKLLAEIERINLVVINTSVATFGNLALDITVIAEMEKEFSMTVKDVVRSLRSALRR